MEPVTLRTPRLDLSIPTGYDIEAIFAACQDPAIQRYTTVPSPYERHHAEGFVPKAAHGWETGSEQTWAIRDGAALAGMIGLYRISDGAAELGYWMAPAARGRGMLVEAARAVIDWAFAHGGLALDRIEWRAVVGNVASARAGRALGFRYEGLLRAALVSPRGRDDGWVAGLLRQDDRMPHAWPVLDG